MTISTSYALHCSVCRGEYFSKTDWLRHLSSDAHQVYARKECLEEWGKGSGRKCCLVIYSSFPLTPGEDGGIGRVIRHFSKDPGIYVTDFVWWEDRPFIAFVQFESRKKAMEVLLPLDDSAGFLISNQRVQARWAMDLLELEWKAILPGGGEFRVPLNDVSKRTRPNTTPSLEAAVEEKENEQIPDTSSTDVAEDNSNWVARLIEYVEEQKWERPEFVIMKSTGRHNFLCSVTINGKRYNPKAAVTASRTFPEAKQKAAKHCLKKLGMLSSFETVVKRDRSLKRPLDTAEEEQGGIRVVKKLKMEQENCSEGVARKSILHHTLPTLVSGSSDSLRYQFWHIRKSVTIPDDEYEKALELRCSLKALFLRNDSTAEVVMFRNWYLKLRNPALDSDLLFYVYNARTQPEHPDSFTWLPNLTILQVFQMAAAQPQFTIVETLTDSCNQMGWKIKYKPSNMNLCLVTSKRFFVEAQLCRLLEYMCTFDPRCHSLLTLVYHWTAANSATIGKSAINMNHMHTTLPEPATLEWLVMLFLCHRGIVPTPREIQQRPHDILTDRIVGMDMGFHTDSQFAQKWIAGRRRIDPSIPNEDDDQSSEKFILSVLSLFQEFLSFCGETLAGDKWILNTRDGELISTEKFLTCEPNGKDRESPGYWVTKMTETELSELRALQNHEGQENGGQEEDSSSASSWMLRYKLNFRQWKLYMIHPFVFHWKFSVSTNIHRTLRLMGVGGRQLKKFLNMRRGNGVSAAEDRFGSLENVLHVAA